MDKCKFKIQRILPRVPWGIFGLGMVLVYFASWAGYPWGSLVFSVVLIHFRFILVHVGGGRRASKKYSLEWKCNKNIWFFFFQSAQNTINGVKNQFTSDMSVGTNVDVTFGSGNSLSSSSGVQNSKISDKNKSSINNGSNKNWKAAINWLLLSIHSKWN